MQLSTILIVFLAVFALAAFLMFRNWWVFQMKEILLRVASLKAQEALHKNDDDWIRYYNWYESLPSFNTMMFTISIWDWKEYLDTLPE